MFSGVWEGRRNSLATMDFVFWLEFFFSFSLGGVGRFLNGPETHYPARLNVFENLHPGAKSV